MNKMLVGGCVGIIASSVIMLLGGINLKPLATVPYVMVIGGLCALLISLELVLLAPSFSLNLTQRSQEGKQE